MRAVLFSSILLLGLGACAAGTGSVTSGATVLPGSGATGQASCVQACDSGHVRCMDAGSARREGHSAVTSIYGAGPACEAELRACLPKCKGR